MTLRKGIFSGVSSRNVKYFTDIALERTEKVVLPVCRGYVSMRITFVLPPVDMSGGIRTLAVYAERLRRRGHRVVVVSVRTARPTLRQIARSVLKGEGWPSLRPAPSHFDGLAVEHGRLNHTGPVTDGDVPDADVVIATWWETAYWVADLSPLKGLKVHFVQGYEVFGGKPEK